MARKGRDISLINQYLVIISLNDGIVIDSEDRSKFFNTSIKYFKLGNIKLFAYSFNESSFRFVLEDLNNLNKVVKQICVSFSIYYNNKYSHTGKVFYDRFKSFASTKIIDTYNFMATVHCLDYVEKYNSSLNYIRNKNISYACIIKQFINKSLFKSFLKSLYFTDDVQDLIVKVIGERKFEKAVKQLNQVKEEKSLEKLKNRKIGIIAKLIKLKEFSKFSNNENYITEKYNNYLIKRNKQIAKKKKEQINKLT